MGELRMERHFLASPERVFAFVTEPDNVIQWWGPEGMTVGEHQLDLSRPGPWFFILVDPAGNSHRMSGEVLVVEPPHAVELTMLVPGAGASVDSTVRFEIRPHGKAGSHFVLIQRGLNDEMIVRGSTRGWVAVLDRLQRLLASP